MAKRGRPIDPNAKRDSLHLRLSKEENEMLNKLSEKSGKSKTDLLLGFVRKEIKNRKD